MAVEKLTPERRREMTRNVLVEAAAEVFARRGFTGASLDEIAEAAGFTRGAIYSNFGGKEDLLLAVVERYNTTILGAFDTVLEVDKDLPRDQRAAAAGVLWRDLISRDPALLSLHLEFRLFALRNEEFREKLAAVQRQQTDQIARLIEREQAAHGFKLKIPARELAEIINAASIGLSEAAGVDREHAEWYARLAERFFVLMAQTIDDASEPD